MPTEWNGRYLMMFPMPVVPGDPYKEGVIIPEGSAVLLWSSWGVEGVYTQSMTMDEQVRQLRRYAAYRNAEINYEIRPLNIVFSR